MVSFHEDWPLPSSSSIVRSAAFQAGSTVPNLLPLGGRTSSGSRFGDPSQET